MNSMDELDVSEPFGAKYFNQVIYKQQTKDEELKARRKQLKRELEQSLKRINSSWDPFMKELFEALKVYIGGIESKLREFLASVDDEVTGLILKTEPVLSRRENLLAMTLRTAEYIRENYTNDEIVPLACLLRLKGACLNREFIRWGAYELKKAHTDPEAVFLRRPDDSALDSSRLRSLSRTTRTKLLTSISARCDPEKKKVFVDSVCKNKFVMVAVTVVTRNTRNIDSELDAPKVREDPLCRISTWVAAIDPKFPYVLTHSMSEIQKEELEDLAKALPGDYQVVRDMHLVDVGLTPVYTSLLKVPSSALRQSEDFRRRVQQDEEATSKRLPIGGLRGAERIVKCQTILKNLIDDGQPGGFKNLNVHFRQPGFQKPITCRLSSSSGETLNKFVSHLYGSGEWKDPTPYVMAKDKKTNTLTLDYLPDQGFVAFSDEAVEDRGRDHQHVVDS